MSGQPTAAPPPYPGIDQGMAGGYPPPNSGYPPSNPSGPPGLPGPHDPSKAPTGYNQPGVPGGGYSQPSGPPGGHHGGHTQGTTVMVAQPVVTVAQSYGESPVRTCCPHCRADIVTAIAFEDGTMSCVICCMLFWFGCGLCCWVPFFVDSCKDVIHTCPNCQQQIGRFSRM